MGWRHKVLTYVEYRAVSGVLKILTTPPPPHPASVFSFRTKGHTRRAVRGWGVNILEDARHRIGLLQNNLSTAEGLLLGSWGLTSTHSSPTLVHHQTRDVRKSSWILILNIKLFLQMKNKELRRSFSSSVSSVSNRRLFRRQSVCYGDTMSILVPIIINLSESRHIYCTVLGLSPHRVFHKKVKGMLSIHHKTPRN